MFKKLLILLIAAFLLTGCFDMSNRFPNPDDQTSDEEMIDEEIVDETDAEEVTDEEAIDDEVVGEEVTDDEITDEEDADETTEDEVDGEDPADEEVAEETDDNAIFVQAFLNKYPEWESKLDTLKLTVNSNDGSFANGSVSFSDEIGGGIWFAANATGGWVIAWDGNGTIGCAEIEPYNFPASIIPECWDDENQAIVDRGAEEEPLE